jgi:hypothetical protein
MLDSLRSRRLAADPWAKLVETCRDELEVARVHLTTTFATIEDYRDDYRLVYRYPTPTPALLPLFWHEKQLQTNMIVLDAAGHNIVYLPHSDTYAFETAFIKRLWTDFLIGLPTADQQRYESQVKPLIDLATFEPTDAQVHDAEELLKRLEKEHPSNASLETLSTVVEYMAHWYVPLVVAPAADAAGFGFVRDGIDYCLSRASPVSPGLQTMLVGHVGRPSRWDWLTFALCGAITIRVEVPLQILYAPPWLATRSLHLRVRLPVGLAVMGKPYARAGRRVIDPKIGSPVVREFPRGPTAAQFEAQLAKSYFMKSLRSSRTEVYAYVWEREVRGLLDLLLKCRDVKTTRIPSPTSPPLGTNPAQSNANSARPRTRGPDEFFGDALRSLRNRWSAAELRASQPSRPGSGPNESLTRQVPQLLVACRTRLSRAVLVLVGLFWVVVSTEWVYRATSYFTLDGFFILLSALFIAVVATAIDSMDKPSVRFPVSIHIGLAVATFFLSLSLKP